MENEYSLQTIILKERDRARAPPRSLMFSKESKKKRSLQI